MTNEELNNALYEKMRDEFVEYKADLLSMPADKILEQAYTYAVKQDIVSEMEEVILSDKRCKALLSEENTLDKVFSFWENYESEYMDHIYDMIEHTADEKIREASVKSTRDFR